MSSRLTVLWQFHGTAKGLTPYTSIHILYTFWNQESFRAGWKSACAVARPLKSMGMDKGKRLLLPPSLIQFQSFSKYNPCFKIQNHWFTFNSNDQVAFLFLQNHSSGWSLNLCMFWECYQVWVHFNQES